MFHQIWEVFNHYFLEQLFSSTLTLPFLQGSNYTSANSFVIVLQVPEALGLLLLLFYFSVYFSFLFRLGKFYWCVNFTDSILCHLHSTIEPIEQVFYFSFVFFSSIISSWSLFITSIYLLIFSMFLFVLRWFTISFSSLFMVGALKSFSDNFNVWFILVLTSGIYFYLGCDFPCSFKDEWFFIVP